MKLTTKKELKLLLNKGRCMDCGDILVSTHVHDFRMCKCGNSFVDGGLEYIRRGGNIEDLSEWEDDGNS